MARKYRDPEAPEVLEAVLERMRKMTREEWIKQLTPRPAAAEETGRTQCTSKRERPVGTKPRPRKTVAR
jgi:hypothetical protein